MKTAGRTNQEYILILQENIKPKILSTRMTIRETGCSLSLANQEPFMVSS